MTKNTQKQYKSELSCTKVTLVQTSLKLKKVNIQPIKLDEK